MPSTLIPEGDFQSFSKSFTKLDLAGTVFCLAVGTPPQRSIESQCPYLNFNYIFPPQKELFDTGAPVTNVTNGIFTMVIRQPHIGKCGLRSYGGLSHETCSAPKPGATHV